MEDCSRGKEVDERADEQGFMDVSRIVEFGISEKVVPVFLAEGITRLNPPQTMALNQGLLTSKNMVVACPTASGKTIIAELAIVNTVLNLKKKAVYIVPLKALGSEKYKDFREKYEPLGMKVALSMGGADSKDTWLEGYDVIIVTAEKLDSLLRHGIDWVKDIGLVVCDEIHLLNDVSRGPTLEVTITRLRDLATFQILGLSATISNAVELSKWLKAELVKSDYRPVELLTGVYHDSKLYFSGNSQPINRQADSMLALIEHIMGLGKQAIVFVNSRPSAESQAEKIGAVTKKFSKGMDDVSDKILHVLSHPTKQCRRLARVVADGAAFHHAGLAPKQKELIEENFKNGKIKVICATPTLAAGVNLPAAYVVVRDLTRYLGGYGMRPIPVLEFQQMAGRAGRPKYDDKGVALACAKNEYEIERVMDEYINAESEKIFSKLALEPVLRTHILSLVATGHVYTDRQLMDFMEKTFYAYQYNDLYELERNVKKIIDMLIGYRLIDANEEGDISSPSLFQSADSYMALKKMKATPLGKRVAELYIDPDTAWLFVHALRNCVMKKVSEIALLHLVCSALEMRPLLRVGKGEYETIYEDLDKATGRLIVPDFSKADEERHICAFKTALALDAWTDEKDEDYLFETYKMSPGELRVKLDNADWLLYSVGEIAGIVGVRSVQGLIMELRSRLKYGVKKELLPLVKIRGIGRVRARALFKIGVTDLTSVKDASFPALVKAVGQKTAEALKKRTGENPDDLREQRRFG
ncbi:MAG: DEAD/DEAH box helicase [archaeon]